MKNGNKEGYEKPAKPFIVQDTFPAEMNACVFYLSRITTCGFSVASKYGLLRFYRGSIGLI